MARSPRTRRRPTPRRPVTSRGLGLMGRAGQRGVSSWGAGCAGWGGGGEGLAAGRGHQRGAHSVRAGRSSTSADVHVSPKPIVTRPALGHHTCGCYIVYAQPQAVLILILNFILIRVSSVHFDSTYMFQYVLVLYLDDLHSISFGHLVSLGEFSNFVTALPQPPGIFNCSPRLGSLTASENFYCI